MASAARLLASSSRLPTQSFCGRCQRHFQPPRPVTATHSTALLSFRRPLTSASPTRNQQDRIQKDAIPFSLAGQSEQKDFPSAIRPDRHDRDGGSSSPSSALTSGPSTKSKSPKGKPASHKPPKRRMEAASAPLRNTPSATRGPLLRCIAHTTAEKYDLANLGTVLSQLGVSWEEVPEGDRERAFVIGPWKGRGGARRLVRGKDLAKVTAQTGTASPNPGSNEEDHMDADDDFNLGQRGEIWVFNSGNFVTWGLTEEEGLGFLRDVIRHKGANVEVRQLPQREYEVEEMDFVVDPDATTDIQGNLIVLGTPPHLSSFPHSPKLSSLLVRYTLSLSLSRSSALSVLEGRLDDHVASVSYIPRVLEKTGAQPMQRKEVIRKLGELMTLRMAVNTWGGGLEDTPDIYWAEPQLESYFDSIAAEFEIKERIETFNRKCDYAQEIQSTLRALLTEASGHRMEVIIIVLIAVEVVLALIREGEDIGHKIIEPIRQLLGGKSSAIATRDQSSQTESPAVEAEPVLGVATSGMYHSDVVGSARSTQSTRI